MSDNIYGPGDDDYGRNPRLGPSKDNPPIIPWSELIVKSREEVRIVPAPDEVKYPLTPAECRPFTDKTARFIEWVAMYAYKDIRGKYRVYQQNIKTTLDSLDALYEWWENNIENNGTRK